MMKSLLVVHVLGGAVALASMIVPLIAPKGGQTHRRGGWVFVTGMTLVSMTAVLLAGGRVVTDPTPEGRAAGGFLLFVAVLTAAGVSAGVRVLRVRHRTGAHSHPWDLGLASVLTSASVAMAVWGLVSQRPLFIAFSVIGLTSGVSQWAYWRRPPSSPMHWWFQHMGSMLGACIAATTAFLVVNAGRFGAGTFALAVWLTPTLIGTPTIALWTAYYRRRFGAVERSAIPAATRSGPS